MVVQLQSTCSNDSPMLTMKICEHKRSQNGSYMNYKAFRKIFFETYMSLAAHPGTNRRTSKVVGRVEIESKDGGKIFFEIVLLKFN